MVEALKNLYEDAYVVSRIRHVVEEIRTQNSSFGLKRLNEYLPNIQRFMEKCLADRYEEAEDLKAHLLSMAQIKDVTFLADVLECAVIPIMEHWMQTRSCVELNLDDSYVLESTATGFMTLRHMESDKYLHSNNDPMDEARKAVTRQYDASKSTYCVWGAGLGYHIYQLYLISDDSIKIKLYEPNEDLIHYAKEYGVLSWIPEDNLEILSEINEDDFLKDITEDEGKFFLSTYVEALNQEGQGGLMEEFIQNCSKWEVSRQLRINYYRNMERNLPDITHLQEQDWKEDMVIIAGGPSVDHVINRLREWQGQKTLIAVGTICRRLLKEGIKPDYMVIMDPNETVYGQIQNLDSYEIPLLLNVLAYWKVARDYKGPMYSLCVNGPIPEVREYAKDHHCRLWESGGTVTALAMDVAIHFGAKKIFLAGADFAYPGGVSHAQGTQLRKQKDLSGLHPVPGVNGETVYADEAFQMYREWMEYRISQTPNVSFINLSDCGAMIKGTKKWQKN